MPSSRGTRQAPGLMQPLISLPTRPTCLCLLGPGWPLCPHRVLSFAFQNLVGLSLGLTKASGSVPAAAPQRATAPGSTRGSWILYGELVSSSLLRPGAPGVAPCPEQRAAALQQPQAGDPRGAAGSPESAPLQPVCALELPGAEAPVPGTGSAHQRQVGPSADLSDGISSATVTRLSLPGLHRLRTEQRALTWSLHGPCSAWGARGAPPAAFSVRARVPRGPATPVGTAAPPELPGPSS